MDLIPVVIKYDYSSFRFKIKHKLIYLSSKRENYAASRIQALWRGHTTRKRLSKANQAMKKFQNSFRFCFSYNYSKKRFFRLPRKRKARDDEIKARERQRAEVQYQATREHYRRLRQFKLQQIQTIQLLPACKE